VRLGSAQTNVSEDEPTTQELRLRQAERERDERESARRAEDPDDTRSHARRADKAAYLREKLEERARSEGPDPGSAEDR